MEFMWAYYKAQKDDSVSVLVQQYAYGGEEACLGCVFYEQNAGRQKSRKNEVCDNRAVTGRAGGYMSGQLLDWFRSLSIQKLLGRGEKYSEWLRDSLKKQIAQTDGELWENGAIQMGESVSLGGVLCLGDFGLLFRRGEIQGVMIQNLLGHGHIQRLLEKQNCDSVDGINELVVECVGLQPDAELVFGTKNFFEDISAQVLKQSLYPDLLYSEEQMKAHVKELVVQNGTDEDGVKAVLMLKCGGTGLAETVEESGKCIKVASKEVAVRRTSKISQTQGMGTDVIRIWGRHGYQVERILGQGAFSTVYCVRNKSSAVVYAGKVSVNGRLLKKEYNYMKQVCHPLFTKAVEFFEDEGRSFLVMEYVPGNTLEELLDRRKHFSVAQTLQVGMELAEGLLYLHECAGTKLYRDLKPANVLVRQDGHIKLIDLGCVCELREVDTSRVGSPGFGAPEQFAGEGKLDLSCDVYGLGRTMEEILGEVKVGRRKGLSVRKSIVPCRRKLKGISACMERKREKKLRKVIENCTNREVAERLPDMRVVLEVLACILGRNRGRKGAITGVQFGNGMRCIKNIWESDYKTLDV